MTTDAMTVTVRDHATGKERGEIVRREGEYAKYAAGRHDRFQWPEGVAEAGDVLRPDEMRRMGLSEGTVIWWD